MRPLTFKEAKIGLPVFLGATNYVRCKIVYISDEDGCDYPIFISQPGGRVFSYAKDCETSLESTYGQIYIEEEFDKFYRIINDTLTESKIGEYLGWNYRRYPKPIESREDLFEKMQSLISSLKHIENSIQNS